MTKLGDSDIHVKGGVEANSKKVGNPQGQSMAGRSRGWCFRNTPPQGVPTRYVIAAPTSARFLPKMPPALQSERRR